MNSRVEQAKQHFKDHKTTYVVGVSCLVAGGVAVFTWYMVRGVASQRIDRGISVVADRGISVIADRSVVTNNVSLISSRRQGAPSWVVRCVETGDIFSSQREAADVMHLPASEISKHLNGTLDHVRGNTFERICLAA